MNKNKSLVTDADAHFYLSIHEVTSSFGISTETIIEIVNEGVVTIENTTPEEWQFDDEACRRIRLALQLHRDLGVNIAGAALAIELMNEIDELHSLLSHLQRL